MRKYLVLVPLLAVTLALSGCLGGTATTSTGPAATAPGTTSPGPAGSATTAPTETTTTPTETVDSSTTTAVTISFDDASVFVADLSGTEVVPPVDTLATGSAVFKIDPTGTRAYFKLTLSSITDVFASRVHEGGVGSNGQGLLILYPGPTLSGPYEGALAQGYFDASVLIGSLTGRSLAEFAALLQSGRAYVNVGTVANPDGEIRGQIRQQ